jgi:hypothetical protein
VSIFRAALCAVTLLIPACSFYEVTGNSSTDGGMSDGGSNEGDGGIDAPPGAFDRCAFSGADDPLRYAGVSAAEGDVLAWDDARAACVRLGMDLAVMNDEAELGAMDPDDATWPMWIGETESAPSTPWMSVDGCPAIAPARMSSGSGCGIVADAGAVAGDACDASAVITQALCETPRPESAACLRDPTKETYVVSPTALAHAAAITYCTSQHAHLVVIDSFAELHVLSGLINTQVAADFWIGETWNGQAWTSETSCPGEFSWADGGAANAALDAATQCTSAVISDSSGEEDDGPTFAGQEITACDAEKLALCEVDPG